VLQLKKVTKGTKQNIKETIGLDVQRQPQIIFQKRIAGAK